MFQKYIQDLQDQIFKKVDTLYPSQEILSVHLEVPKERSHGDYALPIALQLAKELERNPREIALEIQEVLKDILDIKKIEIAGPGFINITLHDDIYRKYISEILKKDLYSKTFGEKIEQTIIIEYPSANVAKPLAIHHLLSTIIGQTFYNIIKKEGYTPISIDHLGDWGTQFGKLIYAYKNLDHSLTLETATVMDLLDLYVDFGLHAKKDETLEEGAREEFAKLENEDKENMKIYKKFVEISNRDARHIFDRLGHITIDEVIGESFFTDKMEPIIEQGIKKKIFTESEGALICAFSEEKLPTTIIRKSDGATLYITRDLAALQYRENRWNPTEIIYVVDVAQKLHFQQVFEISKMLGVKTKKLTHIGFGRMAFKDGTKMSTREGKLLLLEEVIDEAILRASDVIKTHQPDIKAEQQRYLAKLCGIGALKYNVLHQNIHTNFAFDWDSMLSLEGNSAPYLQYTHARAKSILRKSEKDSFSIPKDGDLEILEKHIIQKLLEFPNIIHKVHEEYKTNILCNYLFEMTQDYNAMYAKHSVLQAESTEKKQLRLGITSLFATTLKEGMKLLGIEVPDIM